MLVTPVKKSRKTKKFKPFNVYCVVHKDFRVSSLTDVQVAPGTGPTGGGYVRAFVICPKCIKGAEIAKINVPSDLRLDLIEMKKAE